MTAQLSRLCFDANDPRRLARFWADALGLEISDTTGAEVELVATDATLVSFVFLAVLEPKVEKNRLHLDLVTESVDDQAQRVDRLVELGARHVDIGQPQDADHVILADPEGNEFCVVIRGEFLADTGLLGAVVFEPAEPPTGYFWSAATRWPVVYDEDGDVAIRHPSGRGPFITFGPPGVPLKKARNRLRLGITSADADLNAEVERLIGLGATPIDDGESAAGSLVLADPDGNELDVLRV